MGAPYQSAEPCEGLETRRQLSYTSGVGTTSRAGRGAFFALLVLCAPLSARGEAPVCGQVQAAVDRHAQSGAPELLLDLAPYLGPSAVLPLIERASKAKDATTIVDVYLALGLSRHADALRTLLAQPFPQTSTQRLGRALSLLALGDGAGTGTISEALYLRDAELRRRTARALARMFQSRPRLMLAESFADPDDQVRLTAARVHFALRSHRARRILEDLLASPDPRIRLEAAVSLIRRQHRFRPEMLKTVPAKVRARAIVTTAARTRALTTLKPYLESSQPEDRAGAFAALAAQGQLNAAALRRLAAKAESRFGAAVTAELTMALALMAEETAIAALSELDAEGAARAVEVLWAFSAARAPQSRLDTDHARALAKPIEAWMVTEKLDATAEAHALTALAVADPAVALGLARARVERATGPARLAVIRILGAFGSKRDIPVLVSVAEQSRDRAASRAWAAAAALCRN